MRRYLLTRLATCVFVLFAITLFVFVCFFVLPRNPQQGGGTPFTQNTYRMHGSFPHAYGQFIWKIVRHGDLGQSYATREAVTDRLFEAAPVTLSLVLGGLVVWLALAFSLGIVSALRPRSLVDRASTVFLLIGVSVHPLWLGLMLGYVFSSHWHVFPPAGYCDLFSPSTACGGPVDWSYHLALPWITFGLLNAALYMLIIRGVVAEEIEHDYVRTARAKGASELRILRKHVLANARQQVGTMVGMNVGMALGGVSLIGVIFVETAFGLPGLGGMLRTSILRKDVPMTVGIILFLSIVIMLLNLIVDLAYATRDPRVRYAKGRPEAALG